METLGPSVHLDILSFLVARVNPIKINWSFQFNDFNQNWGIIMTKMAYHSLKAASASQVAERLGNRDSNQKVAGSIFSMRN